MSDYHEPYEKMTDKDRDFVKALHSLKEEVEAINWYHQRVATTSNENLKSILAHNRDEEIEHAVMTIEWLRKNMNAWDDNLKKYLFTDKPVTEIEEEEKSDEDSDLNIGSLKK